MQSPPLYRATAPAQPKSQGPPVYRPAASAQARLQGPPVYRPAGGVQAKPGVPTISGRMEPGTLQARSMAKPQPLASAAQVSSRTVQRKYFVQGGAPGTWVRQTDAEQEYKVLNESVAIAAKTGNAEAVEFEGIWNVRKVEEKKAVLAWMMSDDGQIKGLAAELVGSKQRPRDWRFRDREDAARAVLAESLRGQGEKTEARLAGEVLNNEHITPHILAELKSYAEKLLVYVRNLQDSHYVREDFIAKQGKYKYYYAGLLGRTKMGSVLQEAATQTKVEPLIAAIKDVSSEMYTWMEEESEKVRATGYHSMAYQEAVSAINAPTAMSVANTPAAFAFMAPTTEDIGTVVRPDNVLSEKSHSMKFARKKMMLVDHGPSFSTARLLQLGRKIHATDSELRAVALSLFAFWNKEYWRSTSGIHHYHYVMDMLKNYVPAAYEGGYPNRIALPNL